MRKKSVALLGAHMSIAAGFVNALKRGESIGCTCIQIFTKSNQRWQAKPLYQEEVHDFINYKKNSSVQIVVAHASYLINIGSYDNKIHQQSKYALEVELDRCIRLGIPYLVLHPGTATNSSQEQCLSRISETLEEVVSAQPGDAMILLENTAGQGSSVGYTFEQLAIIRDRIKSKNRIGICFDTCHAFAAGYRFDTIDAYEMMWRQFDSLIGMEHLKAIHLNDSKKDLGSRVDRHEHIGKGKVGLQSFAYIMNDQKLISVPKILEIPEKTGLQEYRENMDVLEEMLEK